MKIQKVAFEEIADFTNPQKGQERRKKTTRHANFEARQWFTQ